jgi:hypothetical protein
VLALGIVCASPGRAQVPDHLQCYRVKDPLRRTLYTADVSGLAVAPGCLVKAPAKLLCVEAQKTNVVPAPPGSADGVQPPRFACYKLKCDKQALAPVLFTDQFGSRTLTPVASKMLCAPAGPNPTTTTTTLPICLDPITPSVARVVEAVTFLLAPGQPSPFPTSCGGTLELCCPNGTPQSCSVQYDFAPGDVVVTPVAGTEPPRYDVSIPMAVTTPTSLPITIPLIGSCLLDIDTAPGPSPTITVNASMVFDSHPASSGTEPTRVAATSVTVSGLTEDDVNIGGGLGCQIASIGIGLFIDTLTSTIADAVSGGACLPCGATSLSACPLVP